MSAGCVRFGAAAIFLMAFLALAQGPASSQDRIGDDWNNENSSDACVDQDGRPIAGCGSSGPAPGTVVLGALVGGFLIWTLIDHAHEKDKKRRREQDRRDAARRYDETQRAEELARQRQRYVAAEWPRPLRSDSEQRSQVVGGKNRIACEAAAQKAADHTMHEDDLVLLLMSFYVCDDVRSQVARHPSCPTRILERLSQDSVEPVRTAASAQLLRRTTGS